MLWTQHVIVLCMSRVRGPPMGVQRQWLRDAYTVVPHGGTPSIQVVGTQRFKMFCDSSIKTGYKELWEARQTAGNGSAQSSGIVPRGGWRRKPEARILCHLFRRRVYIEFLFSPFFYGRPSQIETQFHGAIDAPARRLATLTQLEFMQHCKWLSPLVPPS